jgi:transcriptional regulator with XRE-family HTH domain
MRSLAELARQRIVAWMNANPKITQAIVAREVGVSQSWVSQYRGGTQDADCDQLAVMARVFGHTLTELFDLRPDPRERALLDAFRALTPEKRELAIRMLEAMVPPSRGLALEAPRERHRERR